jgi:FixJ family two-component response regulator
VTDYTGIASKDLIRLGAFDTLKKPATAEQLIDVIERSLGKRPPENPHRKAPAELDWKELRRHEFNSKVVDGITSNRPLDQIARELGISLRTFYRYLHKSGLYPFLHLKLLQDYGKDS